MSRSFPAGPVVTASLVILMGAAVVLLVFANTLKNWHNHSQQVAVGKAGGPQQAAWPIVQCEKQPKTRAPSWKGDGLVLSGFYSEKGRTILRLLNYSSNAVDGQVTMGGQKCFIEELNGKKTGTIKRGAKVSFRPWEFKTFSC